MSCSEKSNMLMTPANVVTIIRICLIPVFMVCIMAPWDRVFLSQEGVMGGLTVKYWVSAIVFALIAATDALDGFLARSRGEVTVFGKFLDPLADKILVAAALICLCELGTLPGWVVVIILAREFIISGVRMLASARGQVIAASWLGKWKTFITMLAIIFFIIGLTPSLAASGAFFWFSWVFMLAAVVLTIASMVDYLIKAQRDLKLFTTVD